MINGHDQKHNYYKIIPPILICLILGILMIYFIFVMNGFQLIWKSLGTLLAAFIIIYLLKPIVDLIENKLKLNRGLSILLAFLLVVFIFAFMLLLIVPGLVGSIRSFVGDLPNYAESFENLAMKAFSFVSTQIDVNALFLKFQESITNYVSTLINVGSSLISTIVQGTTSVVSLLLNLLIAIFMAWYALLDTKSMGKYAKRFMHALLPGKAGDYLIRVAKITDKSFKDFLVSKLITCVVLGFLVYLGIVVANLVFRLNIPYAPLFGLIIGLTNFIPYIGPIIGTVPCLIIALLTGWIEAVVFLCIVLVMQQVDNIFISPKILGDSLGVKPFWVVASVAIGGGLFGTLGMVLSVPVVAVIQQLLTEFIESRENKQMEKFKLASEEIMADEDEE